jgi:hypothetical protein
MLAQRALELALQFVEGTSYRSEHVLLTAAHYLKFMMEG